MPLKLDLKAGEKLMINGAVIENIGGNSKILVHNDSAIIREKEILTEEDSTTPASRVYFALQCAYMFPRHEQHYIDTFKRYLNDYTAAAPSAGKIADNILSSVADGKIYKALKATHKLIHHEADTFKGLEQKVREQAEASETL